MSFFFFFNFHLYHCGGYSFTWAFPEPPPSGSHPPPDRVTHPGARSDSEGGMWWASTCPNIALPSLSATAIQAPRVRAALLAMPPTGMLLRVAPPPQLLSPQLGFTPKVSFQQPPQQPSLTLLASVFQGSFWLSNLLMTSRSGDESWFGSDLQGTHELKHHSPQNPEDTEHRQSWQWNSSQSPKQLSVCSLRSHRTSSCHFVMPGTRETRSVCRLEWPGIQFYILKHVHFGYSFWFLQHLSKASQALSDFK